MPNNVVQSEIAYLTPLCRSKFRCRSMSYDMCSQVHSPPWPGLAKIDQATAKLHPIISFYCENAYILICLNVSHIPICHELRNHRQPGNSNTTKPYGRHPIWHERRYMAILMSQTRCLCLTPGCSHHSEYQLTFTLPVLKIEVMPSIGVYGFLLE